MTEILRCLNPRFEDAGTTLLNEMDEVGEIVFISKGELAVGFEINKQQYFAIKYDKPTVIGAFHVTFFQRVTFIYKCVTRIEGYYIYKKNWLEILDEYTDVAKALRSNILINYLCKVRAKLNLAKHK